MSSSHLHQSYSFEVLQILNRPPYKRTIFIVDHHFQRRIYLLRLVDISATLSLFAFSDLQVCSLAFWEDLAATTVPNC